jgi:propionate catabolism operon transcriptional regulator
MLNKDILNNLNSIDENFKLSKEEILKLECYDWPGNVRELRNVAQKYAITGKIKIYFSETQETKYICLDKENQSNELEAKDKIDDTDYSKMNIDIKEINKYVENKIINMLFNQGFSKTEVASILGISRTALWKKYNKST